MVDMTDDWMNPTSTSWVSKPPENKMVYAIKRQRRVTCFGSPGSITQWDTWDTFDTKEARDAALTKLRAEHPLWILKTSEYNPYLESLGAR